MKLLLPAAFLCLLIGCASRAVEGPKPEPPAHAEAVTYPSGKETVPGFLARPAGVGPFPAVVIVHGDFGLTPWVKQRAERLAGQGYVALAVDLYRGQVAGDLMDAHILGRGLPDDQVLLDLRSAVTYLSSRADVRRDAIGILGWDMGGGYALDAAVQDSRLRGVVVCYGRLTTDPTLLKPLQASVLGIFAGKDEGIPPETIRQFRKAMTKAGKRIAGIHVYPEVSPGFMVRTVEGPVDAKTAAATDDAWRQIDAYLGEELKGG